MPNEVVAEAAKALSGDAKSSISIPTSLLFAVLAGGVGTVSGQMGEGVTADEVTKIVDEKIAAREEIIDLKLSAIVSGIDRMESKIDDYHKTP